MLLGSFPSFATEIIQAFLKPSPPWPIPVLRWEAISGVGAVVHSALQKNQLPRSHEYSSISMCFSRLTIHEWAFAARRYPAMTFVAPESAWVRASFFSFHRNNPPRTYSGLRCKISQMLTKEKVQSSFGSRNQAIVSSSNFFALPLSAMTLV